MRLYNTPLKRDHHSVSLASVSIFPLKNALNLSFELKDFKFIDIGTDFQK